MQSQLSVESGVSAAQVWDFATCTAERVLTGHCGDVKSADWHPQHSIIASGSKDSLVKVQCLPV